MRKVFFSFHYERDCWSVSQVRNSWIANPYHQAQPFLDRAAWEQVQRKGDASIRYWIDSQLRGSSVTVVLVGPETLNRRWVRYEIDESLRLGKGLFAVTLEGMKQANQSYDYWSQYAAYGPFSQRSQTHAIYSWLAQNGRQNLTHWIEQAFLDANKKSKLNWL